jgi:inner membrane protein
MPSPVGHVIAGVTVGWLVAGSPKVPGTLGREALLFGALAALPDIDLLFGAHSGPTHGVGAALVVGIFAGLVQLVRARRPGTAGLSPLALALACVAAYGSHALLDWLGTDTSPPIGIMALWPVSAAYYESDLHLFMAISRRYYHGWAFVRHNAVALVRELVILVPLLMVAILFRPRTGSR